jgi:hypothetical protein
MSGYDRLVQVSKFYEKLILVRRSKARLLQVMTGSEKLVEHRPS